MVSVNVLLIQCFLILVPCMFVLLVLRFLLVLIQTNDFVSSGFDNHVNMSNERNNRRIMPLISKIVLHSAKVLSAGHKLDIHIGIMDIDVL